MMRRAPSLIRLSTLQTHARLVCAALQRLVELLAKLSSGLAAHAVWHLPASDS